MISCTDFIPAYSELFTYLDNHYGHSEVEKFWDYRFAPSGNGRIPLVDFAKRDGVRGCWDYWAKTLKEESASVTRYMNEDEGWIYSEMHHCPSKGKLLDKQKEVGLVPYYDYCSHCAYYRMALQEAGLMWIRNHLHTDQASCASIIYDPKLFNGMITMNERVQKMEIRPSDHEYFHPEFHNSMNQCIQFIGDRHGMNALEEYLTDYTEHVYKPVFEGMKKDPIGVIEKIIRDTYRQEKAENVLSIERTEKSLSVHIEYCPAVKYLHDTGRIVTKWFEASTRVVMQTLANHANLNFVMEAYDEATGAASYRFETRW